MDQIRKAIKANKIDKIISDVKTIRKEDLEEAIYLYDNYWNKETYIAQCIQDLMARIKTSRAKSKIPNYGNHSYEIN